MIIGVDTGGTFTDLVLCDRGQVRTFKIPSTPDEFSRGISNGIQGILPLGAGPSQNTFDLVHSSTVATNALLERKGARTALIATRGFRDLLEIGRQNRRELYNLFADKPEPLVPTRWRREVSGRITADGMILNRVSSEEIEQCLVSLRDAGVDVVAVSLLFSFLNPAHERTIGRVAKRLGLRTALSSDICPEFREFERMSTTVINAYVAPVMEAYLQRLEKSVRKMGGKRLRIIQSNGGSLLPKSAARDAVHTLLSGPAAGVLGALSMARQALGKKKPRLITFDMGGTSTDVSLLDGDYQVTTEANVAGWPVRVPMMDIHTVGAGGGSMARVDAAGALHVGPESAGADPGPCCYGKGIQPTVTDANLLMNRLSPDHFLGGRKVLDAERSLKFMKPLARKLGLDVDVVCRSILRIVNSNMERAIRVISVERGYDVRDFTLVTFGGAGGLHACDLASALNIPRVFVPVHPGVLSAWGAVSADVVRDFSKTVMMTFDEAEHGALDQAFDALRVLAEKEMKAEGFSQEQLIYQCSIDMRYCGQSFEINVPYAGRLRAARNRYDRIHQQRYGHAAPGEPVELVTVRCRAIGLLVKPCLEPIERGRRTADAAQIGRHENVCLYDRALLKSGNRIEAPALILEDYSTTYVPAPWFGRVDRFGHIHLEESS